MSLVPVDDALARLLGDAMPLPAETIPLAEAYDRVLAEPLVALRTQPPFDASAMDGYAARGADVAAAAGRLTVIGQAPAGRGFTGTVGPGETVRIFTGAPLPAGADTVVIQENVRNLGDGKVELLEPTAEGRNVRRKGLDFESGNVLLDKGRLLDAAALSLAASANHPTVAVVRRPLVAGLYQRRCSAVRRSAQRRPKQVPVVRQRAGTGATRHQLHRLHGAQHRAVQCRSAVRPVILDQRERQARRKLPGRCLDQHAGYDVHAEPLHAWPAADGDGPVRCAMTLGARLAYCMPRMQFRS